MPFYIGDTTPSNIFIGTTPLDQLFLGDVEIWRRVPLLLVFNSSGSTTVPTFARFVDVIAIGSGAGGEGGGWFVKGRGGSAGTWAANTWQVAPGDLINFTVPAGGGPGSGGVAPSRGGDGSSAVVTSAGQTTVTAPGGLNYQYWDSHGGGAPSFTYNGVTYPGGSDVTAGGASGSAPGGGAAGGNTSSNGGTGAPARVLLSFRSY